jgi:hypothetical protein
MEISYTDIREERLSKNNGEQLTEWDGGNLIGMEESTVKWDGEK